MKISKHLHTLSLVAIVFVQLPVAMGRLFRRPPRGPFPSTEEQVYAALGHMYVDPLTIEYRANMTEAPKYSLDSRPSWLPSGWDMEKAMDMTMDDFQNLTETQNSLRAGMEANCGSQFKDQVFDDMIERSDMKTALPVVQSEAEAPDWLKLVTKYDNTDDWGLVFYRTTYQHDDEQWSFIKEKVLKMVESEFDENSNIESVNEARQRFKIIWMDDSSKFQDMNLEDVAEHYRSIADSLGPMYKDLNMCFAVDQTSARSISLANPGVAKIHPPLGEYMPFVIAIDHQFGCDELLLVDEDEEDDDDGEEDDDDNDDDDKEVDEAAPFRVYPGSIIDEIYPCLKIGHMETHEYAYGAQGTDNVWFTAFYGIWKLDSEGRYVEPHFEDAAVLKAQHREKKRSLTTAS